jgi:hypothetical protein
MATGPKSPRLSSTLLDPLLTFANRSRGAWSSLASSAGRDADETADAIGNGRRDVADQ